MVGIDTDRRPLVRALVAAGYTAQAVNALQAARHRECLGVSNTDERDAHMLADTVRTDVHQLRPVASNSALAEALKVATRAHKTLVWGRTLHIRRSRHALRDYFPAAGSAFEIRPHSFVTSDLTLISTRPMFVRSDRTRPLYARKPPDSASDRHLVAADRPQPATTVTSRETRGDPDPLAAVRSGEYLRSRLTNETMPP